MNTNITNMINRMCGFKPYKIANKTAWKKEVSLSNGNQKIYQKLPSGTVVKKFVSPEGLIYSKKIIKHNGTEIYSYITNKIGTRNVFVAKKDGDGFKVTAKAIHKTDKMVFVLDKLPFIKKHLFDSIYRLQMKMGL